LRPDFAASLGGGMSTEWYNFVDFVVKDPHTDFHFREMIDGSDCGDDKSRGEHDSSHVRIEFALDAHAHGTRVVSDERDTKSSFIIAETFSVNVITTMDDTSVGSDSLGNSAHLKLAAIEIVLNAPTSVGFDGFVEGLSQNDSKSLINEILVIFSEGFSLCA
jgi:hypothetical protein